VERGIKRFGERVRELRREKAWSLEELADRSGMHWTYVGGIERGERNPSLRNVLRLAKALSVSPRDLF
jgi:transcriptional regulator with XRE-family HTH domain